MKEFVCSATNRRQPEKGEKFRLQKETRVNSRTNAGVMRKKM